MIWHVYIWVSLVVLILLNSWFDTPKVRARRTPWLRKIEGAALIAFWINCIAAVISIYALVAKFFLMLVGF